MRSAATRDGRDGRNVIRPLGDKRTPAPGAGTLGMGVFLVSLAVLFVASLIGFGVVRARAAFWPPAGAPPLPSLLWLSTALLLGCSVTVQCAVNAIRRGNQRALERWLWATLALSAVFLVCQAWAWTRFYHAATFGSHLYGFTFYMLTGLHAAHVIGGMTALGAVTVRARLGAYSWAYFPGVRHVALYWHFLDGVWFVLFGVLWFAN